MTPRLDGSAAEVAKEIKYQDSKCFVEMTAEYVFSQSKPSPIRHVG